MTRNRTGMRWGWRQRKQRGVSEEHGKSGGLGAGGLFGGLEGLTTHIYCLWHLGEPRSTQSRAGALCRHVMRGAGGKGAV